MCRSLKTRVSSSLRQILGRISPHLGQQLSQDRLHLHILSASTAYYVYPQAPYLSCIRNFVVDGPSTRLNFQRRAESIKVTWRSHVILLVLHDATNLLTFKHRLCPVEVWCVGKVFSVQIEPLSELQQFAELHDELLPAHARLSCPLQCVRE